MIAALSALFAPPQAQAEGQVAVILDNSGSMSSAGTPFSEIKSSVLESILLVPRSREVGLRVFGASGSQLVAPYSRDLDELRRELAPRVANSRRHRLATVETQNAILRRMSERFAKDLLQLRDPTGGQAVDEATLDELKREDSATMRQKVFDLFAAFSPSLMLAHLEEALRGGEALEAFILNNIATSDSDLSVLYWKIIRECLPKDMGHCAATGFRSRSSTCQQITTGWGRSSCLSSGWMIGWRFSRDSTGIRSHQDPKKKGDAI